MFEANAGSVLQLQCSLRIFSHDAQDGRLHPHVARFCTALGALQEMVAVAQVSVLRC